MGIIRSYLLAMILLIFTWIQAARAVEVQKALSDTAVERLINQSKYRNAASLISAKLKNSPNLDIDHRLYYCNRLSIAQLRLRNIDSALAVALVSISLSKKSTDSTLIVDAWKAAAYAYNNAGSLDSALFFTRKMMLYGERNEDDKLSRNALTSMATILSQNKRFDEALRYYRAAYVLTLKLNDSLNFSSGKYNLGLTFLNLKNSDSCLFYLRQAAVLAEKNHQNDNLIYIYGTMADCYLLMKNDFERKKYLLLANEIAEKIGNKQFLAMGFSNLARGALKESNYTEAIGYATKALSLLREQPYPVLKMKLDSMMYVACRRSGNFAEAFRSLDMYINEKEKLATERQQQQLNEMVVNLQVKEKDLTIANQQLDITRKKKNMQVMILAMVIGVLLVSGQSIYILKTRRYRKALFKKEKELDREIIDIRFWMEWRNLKEGNAMNKSKHILDAEEDVQEKAIFSSQAPLYIELRDVFDKQKLYLDPELNIKTVIKILPDFDTGTP